MQKIGGTDSGNVHRCYTDHVGWSKELVTATVLQPLDLMATNQTLGLIAGEGQLPPILAQCAKSKGYKIVAIALSPSARARIAAHADVVYESAPGQLGRSMKLLAQNNVRAAVFIGKVPKVNLLRNLHKLDWTAIKELSKLPNFNDDTIQFAVGDICEARGITVLTQSEFLRHLFPAVGVLTKTEPQATEYADIEYGLKIAKEIARLDIGQTVVVKNRMIVAIEAIEGTDEAIKRAVHLAHGPVVVVKVSKPNQDQRFDIPTVGMSTLQSMLAEAPGGVLAIEAHETMMVEKEEMIAFAESKGISIVAIKADS